MAYQATPSPKVTTIEEMMAFVQDQFLAIQRSASVFDVLQLTVSYRVPTRPRPGMLVYADGTSWNPGAGEGVYVLKLNNTWSKL